MLNFLKNISPTELIILAVIFVAFFGSRIFVSLGKTAGESMKEIKNIKKSFNDAMEDEDKPKKKKSK
jgi:Sec-independent protein translocase protein TatA